MHAREVQDTYKVHPTYLSRSTHILGKMCSTIWCDHAKTSCKYHQACSQTFKRGGDKLGYQGHGEGEGACAEAEIVTSWSCTILSKIIMNL